MDRSYLHMGFKSKVLFAVVTCRKCQICENCFLNWYLAPSAGAEPSRHFFLKNATCSASRRGLWSIFQDANFPPLISCLPTGLGDYMKRYGEGIKRVLNSFGPVPDFTGGAAESIVKVSLMAARDQTLTKRDIEPHTSRHGNLQCAVWMSQYSFIKVKLI